MRVIVVGAGEVGFHIAERLSKEGHAVTVIEKDPVRGGGVEARLDAMVVRGSGASSTVLEQAGIARTDLFISVASQDEVNLVSCLLANDFKVPRTIARIKALGTNQVEWRRNAARLGIDLIINPQGAVADEICNAVAYSAATEVAEFANGRVVFIGYMIAANSPLAGVSLATLGGIRGLYRMVVTAITRADKTIIPRGEDVVQPGDVLYFVSNKRDLPAIRDLFGFEEREVKAANVFILGGDEVGVEVARRLAELRCRVRIIDRDAAHCEALAERLDRVQVLNAAGTDFETLHAEGIERADVYIALTHDDQSNILCSLLARRHGAKRVIALVNEREYVSLALSLGVDVCISPRLATASAILKHVRRGGVVRMALLEQSDSEVLELLMPANSPLLDQPLKSLKLPGGSIVGAIVRGDKAIVPDGDDHFEAGDHIIVFTLSEATANVEQFFART